MGKYLVLIIFLLLSVLLWWQRAWVVDKASQLITPEIKVVSQVAGIQVQGVDTNLIKKTLAESNFTLPGQITRFQPNGLQAGKVSVRKLMVVLTPEEQGLGKTFGVGESAPYQSWGIAYNDTREAGVADVTIYLYVRESIVETEEAEKLGKRYQGLLLTAIWDLTHPKQTGDKELARFEGMSEYNKGKIQESWWGIEK